MTPPNSVDNIHSELSRLVENAYLEMPRKSFSSSDNSMDIDTQYSHHHNPYHLQNDPQAEDPRLSTPTNQSTALWDNKGLQKGKVGQFEVLCGPGEGTGKAWSKWRNHDERLPEEKTKGMEALEKRIEWTVKFLLDDIKPWKDARDRLKSLYISLLALGQPTKLQLGILFTSVFPQLIDYNLLVDCEPEHNILLFSLQIATVPSVVFVLVNNHEFLQMILDLLYSFFTHQFAPSNLIHGDFRYIIYPPDL
ncbi:uncharacterized protein MELLADRAFT_89529 [Melampsora larici-populina 98AG31]|uniref:Uncharacterized protein n=1 Tax=Melampsora larici-populina (strain 98AG31 / pathotype 3-4-7) TaxID=747676 RepID=F4RTP7_MELLP|nr:uncharacterized protein MELLADRAFT_89529 [Melampsora larici-populina 98AG31]EGG04293.1 hypothetical protein MELLADRAFT_89529 [Melampsora larici-populina 98AG31]